MQEDVIQHLNLCIGYIKNMKQSEQNRDKR